MHGGDPGIRLFETNNERKHEYFKSVPPRFLSKKDNWTLVPFYKIFGSEELSMNSPSVQERSQSPSLYLNNSDMEKLELKEDKVARISVNGKKFFLPVRINKGLPDGIAGFPVGMPGVDFTELPASAKISGVEK